MNRKKVIEHLVQWLETYCSKSGTQGFVVGVSGGIDSALTSTLCAMTGRPTLLVEMPIHQAASQVSRAQEHIADLRQRFSNVSDVRVDLTGVFETLRAELPVSDHEHTLHLALANSRARLRMTTLYYLAGIHRRLVAGTGNRIEDFGVGFYTKYGDGGVDLSPIADLTKTEVYTLAAEVGVVASIQNAKPTDGLWGDDRSDEDQIGASYPELEWAMDYIEAHRSSEHVDLDAMIKADAALNERDQQVLQIYWKMHKANRHKMDPIPVCIIPQELK